MRLTKAKLIALDTETDGLDLQRRISWHFTVSKKGRRLYSSDIIGENAPKQLKELVLKNLNPYCKKRQ